MKEPVSLWKTLSVLRQTSCGENKGSAAPTTIPPKPKRQESHVPGVSREELIFEPLHQRMLAGKRCFMSHLIPFCFVNGLWLKAGVRYAISSIQGQVHQILSDNIPAYNIDDKSKIFQGVYRLLSIESSPEILKDSLRNVALDMPKQDIAQVSVQ